MRLPDGVSADRLRAEILARCNMSLGNGLGPLADTVFRIGHLGDFGDTAIFGTLAAVELGLRALAIPFDAAGLGAAMTSLAGNAPPSLAAADPGQSHGTVSRHG